MKKIGTKTELAKLLGLTPGRISQLIRRGMPVRSNGRLDLPACVQWHTDNVRRPVGGLKSADRLVTECALLMAPPLPEADWRRVAIQILRAVAAPQEVLQFARVALCAGCSSLQAYVLAQQYYVQPAVNLEGLGSDDLAGPALFPEPSREQWTELLGADFDFAAAETAHDLAAWQESQGAR